MRSVSDTSKIFTYVHTKAMVCEPNYTYIHTAIVIVYIGHIYIKGWKFLCFMNHFSYKCDHIYKYMYVIIYMESSYNHAFTHYICMCKLQNHVLWIKNDHNLRQHKKATNIHEYISYIYGQLNINPIYRYIHAVLTDICTHRLHRVVYWWTEETLSELVCVRGSALLRHNGN